MKTLWIRWNTDISFERLQLYQKLFVVELFVPKKEHIQYNIGKYHISEYACLFAHSTEQDDKFKLKQIEVQLVLGHGWGE